MAYWLVKSEPSSWSWAQQVAAGEKGTPWTGVRNHSAKLNLMAMKKGDRAFFYHSNEGKEIIGIVEVCREYYPDPTDPSGKFGMVDFRAVKPIRRPVALAAIKGDADLARMVLINNSRLSVQPVKESEWKRISALGEA